MLFSIEFPVSGPVPSYKYAFKKIYVELIRKIKGLLEMMSLILTIMSLKTPVKFPSRNFQLEII